MAPPHHPISIIGAGIGGLTLARCLLQRNIPSILYERMSSSPRHGYAITLHPSAYKPLLRILEMDEKTFRHRVAVDINSNNSPPGRDQVQNIVSELSEPSVRVHRGKLELLLREGLDVQWEHALEKAEPVTAKDGKNLVLHFKNGKRAEADLVVAADGVHSSMRKSVISQLDVAGTSTGTKPKTEIESPFTVLPYVTFNGKRRVPRALFNELYAPAFQAKNSGILECKLKDVFLQISINSNENPPTAPEVSISYVYSRPARFPLNGTTDPLFNPTRAVSGATTIPDAFFQELSQLKDLEQPFREVFLNEERLRAKEERILHWLMRSGVVEVEKLREMGRRFGVLFLGEAGYVQPILGSVGANDVVGDAIALGELIASSAGDVGLKDGGVAAEKWYGMRYAGWKEGVEGSVRRIAEMHSKGFGGASVL